jgi:DNA-damage-inducible protein D
MGKLKKLLDIAGSTFNNFIGSLKDMSDKPIFEEIKHFNEIDQEYWSARELYTVLEYIKWDKFLNVIDKAKQACKNSGQEPKDHFPRVEKLVKIGSGANRDNLV